MSYLAIARGVATGYERNESDETSPVRSVAEVELLKARIIAEVDVEPATFDRATYEALWTHWTAHHEAGNEDPDEHDNDDLSPLRAGIRSRPSGYGG